MGVCSIHKLPAGLRKDQPTVFFTDRICYVFVLFYVSFRGVFDGPGCGFGDLLVAF